VGPSAVLVLSRVFMALPVRFVADEEIEFRALYSVYREYRQSLAW
jgi:hypothetical protein